MQQMALRMLRAVMPPVAPTKVVLLNDKAL
jgi:hypothetical protein